MLEKLLEGRENDARLVKHEAAPSLFLTTRIRDTHNNHGEQASFGISDIRADESLQSTGD